MVFKTLEKSGNMAHTVLPVQMRKGSVQQVDVYIIHPSVWLLGELLQVT